MLEVSYDSADGTGLRYCTIGEVYGMVEKYTHVQISCTEYLQSMQFADHLSARNSKATSSHIPTLSLVGHISRSMSSI
jgi:hypothetical protein